MGGKGLWVAGETTPAQARNWSVLLKCALTRSVPMCVGRSRPDVTCRHCCGCERPDIPDSWLGGVSLGRGRGRSRSRPRNASRAAVVRVQGTLTNECIAALPKGRSTILAAPTRGCVGYFWKMGYFREGVAGEGGRFQRLGVSIISAILQMFKVIRILYFLLLQDVLMNQCGKSTGLNLMVLYLTTPYSVTLALKMGRAALSRVHRVLNKGGGRVANCIIKCILNAKNLSDGEISNPGWGYWRTRSFLPCGCIVP